MAIDFQSKAYWVMGVVNITPDSFSDGGQFIDPSAAIAHAMQLVAEGADILDLGAESTRPGALPVGADVELSRLLPVLTALKSLTSVPISIDTSQPSVMQACLAAGADMINDVRSLRLSGADQILQAFPEASVCLMHMQGEPESMQYNPQYDSVVDDVIGFLTTRMAQLAMVPQRMVIDPGFGFGKTLAQNIQLFQSIPLLVALGYPVLVGVSRKSMIGAITGRSLPAQRQAGSVAAAVEAVRYGAKIVRVHDVGPTVDALKIASTLSDHWRASYNYVKEE